MVPKLRLLLLTLLAPIVIGTTSQAQVFFGFSGNYMHPKGALARNLETGPIGIGFQLGGGLLGGHAQLSLEYQFGIYQQYSYCVPYQGHHYQHDQAELTWSFNVHRVSPGLRIIAFPNAGLSPYLEGRAGMQVFATNWAYTDPYQYDNCSSPTTLESGVAGSDLSAFASGGGGLLFQNEHLFLNLGAQYVLGGTTRYLTANKEWADPEVRADAGSNAKGTESVTGPYTRRTSRTDGIQFQLGFGVKF